jgi:dTDP-4-dehydrorhamnose reductase
VTLELWAGAECTINRVGDRYFDQCARTGHYARLEDIDRLADLGVRRVRFPVLWERVAPSSPEQLDFEWQDACLERLRARNVEPILGLVHHGSGPSYASLETGRFAAGLAQYAAAVARRYPWARMFTPVNEPLTTARFCGLYGHWFPHRRDTRSFLRLLLDMTHATREAMRAIREITPEAQLVQTEDGGRTYGTSAVARQVDYENNRRWLSFDLLCGAVTRAHPLREHLEAHGIADRELEALCASPCPPDMLGINYYVTSDRFLDHRIERYPARFHGGNAFMAYADVEAVRVRAEGIAGHGAVLREVWQRYRRPIALTEVHLGCTIDEQARWLHEAWSAALAAQSMGVDVRALTVWSAFGALDWSSLVTLERGDYEPGLFDVRAGHVPLPTALASMAQALAQGAVLRAGHPALSPGWWRRPDRFCYPAYAEADDACAFISRERGSAQPQARSALD